LKGLTGISHSSGLKGFIGLLGQLGIKGKKELLGLRYSQKKEKKD
jgi:hypothetical protein